MEMFMISPTELKVMMNAADMKQYNLESDRGRNDSRRLALRLILKEAEIKTGFESEGKRLLVKMFPSRDGGCEMFVTRLGEYSGNTGLARDNPGKTAPADGSFIYSFSKLGEMICACRRLSEAGYNENSAAYSENERPKYYLVLGSVSPLVCEMGGKLMKSGTKNYINEYCSLICERAVDTLASFA